MTPDQYRAALEAEAAQLAGRPETDRRRLAVAAELRRVAAETTTAVAAQPEQPEDAKPAPRTKRA